MKSPSRVRISELKAHLSEYLRKVQRGLSLTVLDRDTPIAVLSPPLIGQPKRAPALRKGRGRLDSLHAQPPLSTKTDSLAALLDDRSRR